ncbi:MAG: DUF167 domain-containing protein [Actinomycetota bacterium]|nr:DUF167 domain-containing protein [Actinomycetota bacterium]
MKPVRISVHVTPKSGRDEIAGWRGGELSVRVTVAPEGGKANAATCRVVAGALGVPKGTVTVVRGESSRHKQVEITGLAEDDLRRAFGQRPEGLF